ncbi:class I SAM-dependent methyltransferase [Mesorhizobium amorphae]|uniref:O-methyltransferase n=1 Tax=Mesorhizobium amorphae TaxID=71433 RepID=UPI003ED02672
MFGFGKKRPELAPMEQALLRTPARHKLESIILSSDDEAWQPTRRLVDLAIRAASRAADISFPDLDSRKAKERRWYRTWPGEHYRLLAALVADLEALNVIEIGTWTGMGTLSIASALPPGGRVVTFDIVPWNSLKRSWFRQADFADGRIVQHLADVTTPEGMEPYRSLFAEADFIFIDAPKDGVTEQNFIDTLGALTLPKNPIVMFDDTRVLNMIHIWRQLKRPKLDITSFGHWSGTGLVDWNGKAGTKKSLAAE